MNILEAIIQCETTYALKRLTIDKQEELTDWIATNDHRFLLEQKDLLSELAVKRGLISELNFTRLINVAFVNGILAKSIIIGDRFLFESYFRLVEQKGLNVTSLVSASSTYLVGVSNLSDLQNALSKMLPLLKQAYFNESDNGNDVEFTLIKYYTQALLDFGEFNGDGVQLINESLKQAIQVSEYSFLNTSRVRTILNYPNNDPSLVVARIFELFKDDQTEERKQAVTKLRKREFSNDYENRLYRISMSSSSLIALNKDFYSSYPNKDEVFNSLFRGVEILQSEEQLVCYLAAYGQMHFAKLKQGLQHLPKISQAHTVVDWGCGQGLASLAYFEDLKGNSSLSRVQEVILIEPSISALERAKLHVKQYEVPVRSIDKEFDKLSLDLNDSVEPTLHFFSNILDVELFSMKLLLKNIQNNFQGLNYFMITSPYINELKTARIDTFVSHFEDFTGFEVVHSINLRKGLWENNWSIVLRIFKVVI